jgi:hypothetical protein
MAITATTLSGAVAALDASIGLTSATGVTAQSAPTGVGLTYLYTEGEMMIATLVTGTQIGVIRGQMGTKQIAHATLAAVLIGGPADFPNFTPGQNVFTSDAGNFTALSPTVASATSIVASGRLFHVSGTTATQTITPPAGFVEGSITVIADGVWTWTAAGNILVAGTVTTAGGSVTFIYDRATSKWYPSRLA